MAPPVMFSTKAGHRKVEFQLSSSTVLQIYEGDITDWSHNGASDAIVNPTTERMVGGSGLDAAIHRAAGPELKKACHKFPEDRNGDRCPLGDAKLTEGFELSVKYVIHTVGPKFRDPKHEDTLINAYRNSLKLAKENNIKYIAFPAISCGAKHGYPHDKAAHTAISALKEFIHTFDNAFEEVHIILHEEAFCDTWLNEASEVLLRLN